MDNSSWTQCSWPWGNEEVRSAKEEQNLQLGLSEAVLQQNALWFIRLRWYVSLMFLFIQAIWLLFPTKLLSFGLTNGKFWFGAIAALLICANILFQSWSQNLARGLIRSSWLIQIWTQIVFDLICLTLVVYFVGIFGTPAPFLYVLHIALACVFFSAQASLLVTLLACGLYGLIVLLGRYALLPPSSLFTFMENQHTFYGDRSGLIYALWIAILFVFVWYVTSRLSKIIRIHEAELVKAEAQTRRIQKEKEQYTMAMTHELKAPLAAVISNIELVLGGYCGSLSEDIRQILSKTVERARRLSSLIIDILKLERLKSSEANPRQAPPLDLAILLQQAMTEIQVVAEKRQITFTSALEHVEVHALKDQIALMFSNILANAVNYSHPGGTVTVSCYRDVPKKCAIVTIADQGIGIPVDQLPLLFDDSFRSSIAQNYNPASTSIGLAIVKRVAQIHAIRIDIASAVGQGTKVSLTFSN
jgi:signal transduction histidine kinase